MIKIALILNDSYQITTLTHFLFVQIAYRVDPIDYRVDPIDYRYAIPIDYRIDPINYLHEQIRKICMIKIELLLNDSYQITTWTHFSDRAD